MNFSNIYNQYRVQKILNLVIFSIAIFYSLYLMNYHRWIILSPWQFEYREGAMLIQVGGMLQGLSNFSFENLPIYFNPYGSLFNEVARVFASVLGNTFSVLRLVSGIAIILSSGIIWFVTYKLSRDFIFSFILTIGFYLQSLFFVIPQARPDAMGALFFILGFAVAELIPLGLLSSALVFTFAMIGGFFGKAYFIFIGPIAFSYWIIFKDWKRGLAFSLLFGLLGILAIFITNYFSPGYISSAMFTTLANSRVTFTSETWAYMLKQGYAFSSINRGLIAILCAAGLIYVFNRFKGNKHQTHLSSTFSLYALILLALDFIFSIGHGMGNYLTYIIALCTPALIFTAAACWPKFKDYPDYTLSLGRLLLLLMTIFVTHNVIGTTGQIKNHNDQLSAVSATMKGYSKIYGSPMVAGIIHQLGQTVYDTGHNQYLVAITKFPNIFHLGIPQIKVEEAYNQYQKEVEAMISHGDFDLIVLDQLQESKSSLLKEKNSRYRLLKQMNVDFWHLNFWVLKH
ncbi:MAG: hypothetical protein OEV66_02590 [Spirochaetia bacterium]|nr:hypothetical protein [Spirochaetia bacterium]